MLSSAMIGDFFRKYGSKIQDENKQITDYGVMMPTKRYGSDMENLQFRGAGFEAYEEFVMISLGKSGIVKQGALLWISGRLFQVVSADFYHYANQKLYQRAYLHERRTLTLFGAGAPEGESVPQ